MGAASCLVKIRTFLLRTSGTTALLSGLLSAVIAQAAAAEAPLPGCLKLLISGTGQLADALKMNPPQACARANGAAAGGGTCALRKTETQTLKDNYGRDVPLSVLSLEEASQIFCKMQKTVTQRMRNPAVCAQRAMVNAYYLEKLGLKTGKIFAAPTTLSRMNPFSSGQIVADIPGYTNQTMRWGYHVANVILVRTREGVRKFVLDPFLFPQGPVPQEEWQQALTRHNRSAGLNFDLTSPYVFRNSDKYDDPRSDFEPLQLANASCEMESAYDPRVARENAIRLLPTDLPDRRPADCR